MAKFRVVLSDWAGIYTDDEEFGVFDTFEEAEIRAKSLLDKYLDQEFPMPPVAFNVREIK